MKLLFVHEKWVDGNPNIGLTNNIHNLHGSLVSSGIDATYDVVFLDECFLKHKTHIDIILPSIVDSLKPDVVIFSFLGSSAMNPTKYSLSKIKGKTKLVFIWPDLAFDWALDLVNKTDEYADLHVGWGSEQNIKNDKLIWLFAPQDERMYHNKDVKSIPISFIGSLRQPDRLEYLQYAYDKGLKVVVHGGQRPGEGQLTPKQYAEMIRKSQITINFPGTPQGDQMKGRVIEALGSGCVLLEKENNKTSKKLHFDEYVSFSTKQNFVEVAKSLLTDRKTCDIIAKNGRRAYEERFSAKIYWTEVLNKL